MELKRCHKEILSQSKMTWIEGKERFFEKSTNFSVCFRLAEALWEVLSFVYKSHYFKQIDQLSIHSQKTLKLVQHRLCYVFSEDLLPSQLKKVLVSKCDRDLNEVDVIPPDILHSEPWTHTLVIFIRQVVNLGICFLCSGLW